MGEDLNTLDEEAFVERFGPLFEHSPWVAREAYRKRPFGGAEELRAAFAAALHEAPRERQVALIRAHPELAGREAAEGELTEASESEQASAGLNRLSPAEHAELAALNRSYRERFGFPFVVCVREHTKGSIFENARARVARTRDEEIETAIGEIAKIAALRLEDVLA
jgi:OHCU decarboxylase